MRRQTAASAKDGRPALPPVARIMPVRKIRFQRSPWAIFVFGCDRTSLPLPDRHGVAETATPDDGKSHPFGCTTPLRSGFRSNHANRMFRPQTAVLSPCGQGPICRKEGIRDGKVVEDRGCLWISGIPTHSQTIHRKAPMWTIWRHPWEARVDNSGVARGVSGDNVVDNVENSTLPDGRPRSVAAIPGRLPTWRRLGG